MNQLISIRLRDKSITELSIIKAHCKEQYTKRISGDNKWLERYEAVSEILNNKISLIFE